MTSRWSAPGPRGFRPRFMAPPKVCPLRFSTLALSAVRPGASARIENYFGFPTGISGQALTARAFIQAQKFGADVMIPVARQDARLLARQRAHSCSRRTTATAFRPGRSWSPAARAIAIRRSLTSPGSRAAGSGTGPRRSKRVCAPARRSCWSAAAIRPARARCFCPPTPRRCA